jgi:Rha family phage regulatory protein
MNELVYLRNEEAMTDSLMVAEIFNKRHTDVLRDIKSLDCSEEFTKRNFALSRYKDSTGKFNPMYRMTKNGFTFLVMGYRGKKAARFKEDYIKAFDAMEDFILERSTQTWIETRQAGKLTRKAETDTIQRLVEYAKEQGSTHSDKLYIIYTKLANKMAGVEKRDQATVMQLNNLSLMENIILHMIDTGILMGKHYKDIYKDCKARLETVSELAYLKGA